MKSYLNGVNPTLCTQSTSLRRADERPTTTRLSARRRTMIGGTSASHRLVVGRSSAHPTKSRGPSYVGSTSAWRLKLFSSSVVLASVCIVITCAVIH